MLVSLERREAGEQLPFAALHPLRVGRFGVVVLEEVEHAVHDEERELVVEALASAGGVPGGDARADDDVAEHDRWFAGVDG